MIDIEDLVQNCRGATAEPEPRLAIKEVVTRACSRPAELAAALPPERAGIVPLHVSPALTVLNVVWAPGMTLRPHDHRMWACIGIYTGGEDNTFFRREERGLAESGGRELRVGDTILLGDDTIHQVHNPTTEFAGAIHVYGGDFFSMPRSEWDPATLEERPYDVEGILRYFEEQNARFDRP
jgi:predicted metal-dependent enzyme (double-stranded beta helix superfamily)